MSKLIRSSSFSKHVKYSIIHNAKTSAYATFRKPMTNQPDPQKRLAESEKRLRQAIRAARLGFWDYDILTDTLVWSQECMEQWDVSIERGSKKDVYERVHPDDAPLMKEAFERAMMTGQRYQIEMRVIRTNGDVIWIESQGDCIFESGRAVRVTGTSLDITQRKCTEAQLRLAKIAAEEANAAKTQFLANMSHEIRTPLGAIIGFLGLLKNKNLSRTTFQNYLAVIERNSDQLLRLVDDILDLSKVEAGRMLIEKTDIDLPEFLSEIASLMNFRAKERGIEFKLIPKSALPASILADSTRIRQILGNIVGNAIKFTDHGSVSLEVEYENQDLSFTVTDTGLGLSPEQRERLFRPFSQADASTSRRFGGTGLGLILTKRLCETMGGHFTLVHSEVGVGSQFKASIRIEVKPDVLFIEASKISLELTDFPGEARHEPRLTGMRVLVVEDSPDNRELIEILLTQAGAIVDLAQDGQDGVQKALEHSYNVVLMDIQMPNLDGHQAAQALRARGYRSPLVALTAHAMKEEQERCILSGFTNFLSKPIQYEMMLKTLENFRGTVTPPNFQVH